MQRDLAERVAFQDVTWKRKRKTSRKTGTFRARLNSDGIVSPEADFDEWVVLPIWTSSCKDRLPELGPSGVCLNKDVFKEARERMRLRERWGERGREREKRSEIGFSR